MEIWKDIKDYEGFYQVSNYGNVKSLGRIVNGKNNTTRIIKDKIIVNSVGRNGYNYVRLCKNGIPKTFTVHQLVCTAFLNHICNGYTLVVNHKNFDRQDNHLENLEITTMRENGNQKHLKHSSQYTGVSWHIRHKKWISSIRIDNKLKYLGFYSNEIDAHYAYEKEKEKITLL